MLFCLFLFLSCSLSLSTGQALNWYSWNNAEKWTEDWYWGPYSKFAPDGKLLLTNTPGNGYLFSKQKISHASWEVQYKISLGDSDGVGFFATSLFPARGAFVGIDGEWEGLGVFVLAEKSAKSSKKFPLTVQAVLNSGEGHYDGYKTNIKKVEQHKMSILGQCVIDRAEEMSFRVRYHNSELMVEIESEGQWKTCIYTIAEIRSTRLQTGWTSIIHELGKQSAYLSYFIAKEPELPLNDGDDVLTTKSQDNKDVMYRQMWAKIMNKLNGFDNDMKLSTQYVTNLIAESNAKITQFETAFQPLAVTIETLILMWSSRVLDIASRKIVEIDEEGKSMDVLEEQIKALEYAIERVETGLSTVQTRLRQGQALFDGVSVKPKTVFQEVDWWFGLLVVQTILLVAVICWRSKKRRNRFRN